MGPPPQTRDEAEALGIPWLRWQGNLCVDIAAAEAAQRHAVPEADRVRVTSAFGMAKQIQRWLVIAMIAAAVATAAQPTRDDGGDRTTASLSRHCGGGNY